MPFDTQNIFTRVEAGIWSVLEADAAFTALVPEANRLKYHGEVARPELHARQESDYPLVRLIPFSGVPHGPGRSSNTATFRRTWQLQIGTGDPRTSRWLNEIEWEVFRVFEMATASVALPDVAEVIKTTLVQCEYGLEKLDENGQRLGWAGVLNLEVELKFNRSTITA